MKLLFLVLFVCIASSLHLQESSEFQHNLKKHQHLNMEPMNHQYNWGHYNSDDEPDKGQLRDRWITNLPDDKPISQISIPGTHDSGTFNCKSGQFCDNTQTQTWGLAWQLRAGIRFFDLRLNTQGSEILIGHGGFTFYSLEHNLRDIKNFLDNNPTQFVITALQTEKGQDKVSQAINVYNSLGLQRYTGNSIPTVGQLRGKVWVTCGDRSNCGQAYYLYMHEGVVYNQPGILIQNIYKVYTWNKSQKVDAVMNLAKLQCQNDKLKVNFLSGNYGVLPYWMARSDGWPNEKLDIFLRNNNYKGCLGITIMDYPGCRLINEIINSNF